MMRPNCAGSLTLPSTRTTESLEPFVMRPAGTSWFASRIALITWSTPRPSAVSASGLIWTRICRATRPLTSMRATPGRFSSALTIVWSVSDVSSRRPVASDVTASVTTGWLFSFSTRITCGSLTSRGNVGRIGAMRSRTSCIACATLVVSRTSTKMSLRPSRAFEHTRLPPGTWFTAYSIGFVTSASTASGAAPGYTVVTNTNGKLTSGICSTLSRAYEKTPRTVIATITIVAKTGLLIEVRVIHMAVGVRARSRLFALTPKSTRAAVLLARRVSRRRGRLHERRRAVLEVVEARGEHRHLRRQRGLDLDAAVRLVAPPGDHDAARELAAVDRPHVRLARLAAQRGDRQRRCRRAGRERDAPCREHAAAQRRIGIGQAHVHDDRARAWLGRRIDPVDASTEAALAEAVDGELDRHAERKLRHVDRRHERLDLEVAQVDDGHDRRLDRNFLAALHVPLRNDAGKRRHDLGIGERVLRKLQLRLGRFDAAARDVERRLGVVERVLGYELVVEQPHVHRARLLGEPELRARALERTGAVDEPRLEIRRIDARDRLPGAHALAFPDRQADDVAGHFRLDHRLMHRLQRARHRQPARERRALDIGNIACDELQRDRRRIAGTVSRAFARAERDGTGQACDEHECNHRDGDAPPPAACRH